jgi:Na+/serine symporter
MHYVSAVGYRNLTRGLLSYTYIQEIIWNLNLMLPVRTVYDINPVLVYYSIRRQKINTVFKIREEEVLDSVF